jgi:hypothetical protein
MAEHLADGRRAVVAAGQQAGNGGHLVRLGGTRGRAGRSADGEQKHAPKHAAKHLTSWWSDSEVRSRFRYERNRRGGYNGKTFKSIALVKNCAT